MTLYFSSRAGAADDRPAAFNYSGPAHRVRISTVEGDEDTGGGAVVVVVVVVLVVVFVVVVIVAVFVVV